MYPYLIKYALRSDICLSLLNDLQAYAALKYAQGIPIPEIARQCSLSEEEIENALEAAEYCIANEIALMEHDGDHFISFPLKRQDYYLLLSALHTVQESYFFECCHSGQEEDWKQKLNPEIKKLCKLYELLQSGLFEKVKRPGILSWEPEEQKEGTTYLPPIFPTISISDWIQDS